LILAGGPKVNTLVAEINDKLPIRYTRDNAEVYSSVSKKTYSGNIGVVELVANPFAKTKFVLVVSGLNQNGTRAAVLAVVKHPEWFTGSRIAIVVEGFDEDGDGQVDGVERLE
jgi:S-layer protein (TIGR01564 family)